jgi:hypothetical protein
MKMSFNRKLMLAVLGDEIEGCLPPHSVDAIYYALETAITYKFVGWPYDAMDTLPSKRQIYRTLAELWGGGFIVGWRKKNNDSSRSLPYWETHYQLSCDVYRNTLMNDCKLLFNKVSKAKFGINLFGAVMDMGLPACEVAILKHKVKSLMQKTHPDKASGFEEQFMQMKTCSDLIKSGIPEPTSTHTKGHQSTDTMELSNG